MQVTNAPPPPKTYAASEVTNDSAVTGTNVDDALDNLDTAIDAKLDTSSYTAADVLSKLLTVDGSGTGLDADTVDGQHAAAFQPIDADLTAIAALSPSNDDIIQRKAGAWTNRTIAQLLTDATEGIQDLVGAMVSSNTETNITVTYQDTDGTIDFVVPTASTSVAGVVELATDAETETATATDRAVTPANLAAFLAERFVGSVVPFAGATAPTGWLFCYGQNVSRTTYSALFTAISTTFGSGNGSTTFTLPDLRGRVVAGKDNMGGTSANRLTSPINGDNLAATGGTESHTLTTPEMPSHNHLQKDAVGTPTGSNVSVAAGGLINNQTGTTATDATGGGGAHNNMQPTIILNYIIYAAA